jgi:prohibitin 1
MVSITLRVMSRPDVSHLARIYQTLGLDYDERVRRNILEAIGNPFFMNLLGPTFHRK